MSKISRRDFINGSLVAAGTSLLAGGCNRQKADPVSNTDLPQPENYPPALTGLRGNHEGSYACAHERAWAGISQWGSTSKLDEQYDLVVVGGGISGLSAAFFYQQQHGKDKKILILDNHDDFGGHARRNEHTVGGQTQITYGGSQSLVSPHAWSATVKKLMSDLNVNVERFKSAYDRGFYKKHNLKAVTYFDKQTYGQDKIVDHPFSHYPWWVEGLPRPQLSNGEAVDLTPLSQAGKQQLLNLIEGGIQQLQVPQSELNEYLSTHSYLEYLQKNGVTDPGVMQLARTSCSDWAGTSAEVLTIGEALACGALGLDPSSWKVVVGETEYQKEIEEHGNIFDPSDPYIYHFPDGNATIARLLVKNMVPQIGPGDNAEEIVLSKFDYSQLDKPSNPVRVRLSSTVVKVQHVGVAEDSNQVDVQYVNGDKTYQVKAKNVVMACYNMMIPHLVPQLPKEQASALSRLTKIPLQYTTVGLNNWRAFKNAGIGMVMSPGKMHQVAMIDFPVSIGGQHYAQTPEQPNALVMIGCHTGPQLGIPPIEQFRQARAKMLALSFENYEAEVREHLNGMLPGDSFDFDRDVSSITVNRWAHGYIYSGSALHDSDLPEMAKKGRQPFGRIAIANIDSGLSSYLHVAVDQAWRAIGELDNG